MLAQVPFYWSLVACWLIVWERESSRERRGKWDTVVLGSGERRAAMVSRALADGVWSVGGSLHEASRESDVLKCVSEWFLLERRLTI